MKIGTKLVASFAGVAGICGIVGVVGVVGLTRVSESVSEIGEHRLPGVQNLLEIRSGGLEIKAVQRTLLDLNLPADARQRQYDRLAQITDDYSKAWRLYDEAEHMHDEEQLWNRFTPAWDAWIDQNETFFTLAKQIDALDLGNPDKLRADLEIFRGDHYKLANSTSNMIHTGELFDGGEDPKACRFGKWLSEFKTSNASVNQIIREVHDPHDAFHTAVGKAKQLISAGDKEGVLTVYRDELIPAEQQVFDKFRQLREMAGDAQTLADQAEQMAMITCRDLQREALGILDEIVAMNEAMADEAVEQGKSAAWTAELTAGAAVVAGVVIALALGLILSRAIIRVIRPIVSRAEDIAAGDLTGEDIPVRSQDELGELTRSINHMAGSLKGLVTEVTQTASEVAGAATEIAASSEEMARGMEEQNSQTTQVSSAVEQMSASIVEVARKSTDAVNASDNAGKQAAEGGEVVRETIDGINAISDVVKESAVAINELGRRGEQIGEIIKVINDIADQTNLLALNAAIEAARAGEHGRGFAVVADEVRKLADRTTKATEEIADSIRTIQEETGKAVGRMNDGTEHVNRGVELAARSGDVLDTIVTGSRDVAGLIQSIAASAEQQSAASEQISRNVENITAVSRQATEGAAQAAAAAGQLSQKAEVLQELVRRFRIDHATSA